MSYIVIGIVPAGGDLKLREQYLLVQFRCNYNVVDRRRDCPRLPFNRDVDYVFPFPPSAAVCSFKAVIDDKRTIKGVVRTSDTPSSLYTHLMTPILSAAAVSAIVAMLAEPPVPSQVEHPPSINGFRLVKLLAPAK
ncbi:hypothetical protein PIIN_08349 [Serendipita indica DSM 11827]|uniref:VIT domain-containing protein n=1 Tax=Serendipita indica (strain DSM 11827) TaxID=1109443 RepID=G4TSV4_SERID|nr:hypothetical protein PIIN_08349 [Serendipita indica DSM 11827]